MYVNNRVYLFTSYKYLLCILRYATISCNLYTLNIIKFNFRYITIKNNNHKNTNNKV